MMVTNSISAYSPSLSPAKPVTVTQQKPTNAGFRLHTPVSSSEAEQSDVSSIELNTEDSSDELLFGNTALSMNLGTQAQTFMPVTTVPAQDSQSGIQANTLLSLKVSTYDLQPSLSLPTHDLISAGNMLSQIPATQHSNSASQLAATQSVEWAAVRVDTGSGKWGEQMLQVLQDRVTVQAQQNLQEAKIRLDPPELGKLDLLVRVEGDRLSVQINATNAVTREALIQVSERLRAELQEQNFVHVDVNVGSEQGHERSHHTPESDEITILAAREAQPLQSGTTANYSEHWLNTQA
ncbi:MAG: flagellar hook-length control protein FliK [Pseudomonadota bacterium]|nr:flagellar hook-length control protein FliK [Pseudomonadota bacterium]